MKDGYAIRPIAGEEVPLIKPLLEQLASHHNRVALSFSGVYPTLPIDSHITHMKEHVRDGTAHLIGAFLPDGALGGFGMASVEGGYGEVDYLIVNEDMRGGGMGGAILAQLLDYLKNAGATLVDVKVVHGNPARDFYETHGFALRTDVLSMQFPKE